MAVALILFFYFSRRRIIKTQLEKVLLEISLQKEIIQSIIITQEKERSRIAQDLHDAISSKLNIVSLNANFLKEENISSKDANKLGNSIVNITTTVLESSRKIAHDLLPPTLQKFGLKAALEELFEELFETKKFKIDYKVNYSESFLIPNDELHLFRVTQELINNTIKHSEASLISFELETKENALYLHYKDNGIGFNPEEIVNKKSIGISGIENRIVILNGELNIELSPSKGISVSIEIKKLV